MFLKNNFKIILCLFLILIINFKLFSKPKRVIIFRHGEKELLCGNLSPKGIERSFLLARYFKNHPEILLNKVPKAFFACEGRTIETITPTAESFPQAINIPFQPVTVYYSLPDISKGRFRDVTYKLSEEVLKNPIYNDKIILVCWEHKNIPLLAHLLGAFQAPYYWDDSEYDVFWIITYESNLISFSIKKQNLFSIDLKPERLQKKVLCK